MLRKNSLKTAEQLKNRDGIQSELSRQVKIYSIISICIVVLFAIYTIAAVLFMTHTNITKDVAGEQAGTMISILFVPVTILYMVNTMRKIKFAYRITYEHTELTYDIKKYRNIATRRAIALLVMICILVACIVLTNENMAITSVLIMITALFVVVHDTVLAKADAELLYLNFRVDTVFIMESFNKIHNKLLNK